MPGTGLRVHDFTKRWRASVSGVYGQRLWASSASRHGPVLKIANHGQSSLAGFGAGLAHGLAW